MNRNALAFAFFAAALLAGCTPQTRQEYKQAGNEAAQAVKTDASAATHAARAADSAAKKSLNNNETEHPAEKKSKTG